jgi:hypothetical protein
MLYHLRWVNLGVRKETFEDFTVHLQALGRFLPL